MKKGQTKSKPHLIKHIPGVAPTARADAGKAHLIISEKKDKKASKYLVKDLPHPYTSQAQFERSLSVPVGAEWNTRTAFQKGTLPKVVTKVSCVFNELVNKQAPANSSCVLDGYCHRPNSKALLERISTMCCLFIKKLHGKVSLLRLTLCCFRCAWILVKNLFVCYIQLS